jgi:hypothetical protein
MTQNVGGADRVIRIAVGAALVAYAVTQGVWWGWLGLIPLGTALIRWCPAYLPFGINTCKKAA